ncbi:MULTISPECIES: winged helix-turn-helix domain-containing protein [Pseudonocardia]|uniref:Transcriptional regulatory protein tctD n=2 Tax=Pseudonocardia TaxID=1847 RepID=A0A1Y2MT85_PSEAH|nr:MULTISPECIES: winged helix-turn-helix domain-containing protein [Pseudonocardia]OSY37738.1 Transcriptional regulatory protein tctD [Pseudonocardia autotrophica]TDN75772.1 transcriptional regulator [Pseudonocardia autotrophica]BBF99743.1 hypothetical protein Pdca_09530 [Pseudonocardia autotrophica]GEC27115.1 hypothetical protein PSA01_41440 [Pseudonocardia saturnea]
MTSEPTTTGPGPADPPTRPRVRLLVEIETADPAESAHDVADVVRTLLDRLPRVAPGHHVPTVSVLGSAKHPLATRGVYELGAQELLVDGVEVRLTPRESTVLTHLVQRPHQPVSRQELCERLDDADGSLGPRAVDVILSRLRAKLTWTPAPVVTVRGVGYRYDPSERFLVIDGRP